MPTPTIPAGNLFMNATTYTGTGASLAVTNGVAGQSFQPDFVWTKTRSTATGHTLFDSIRGVTNYLQSNNSNAEGTTATTLTAFNSNGFTVGSDSSTGASGVTYVGWQWKAGGTAVTNTAGSISSQVSANTTSGFSVVTYSGNSTSGATVGHGLGVAPSMVILKRRNGTEAWPVYHSGMPSAAYYMRLNATDAQDTAASFMNNTAPSSTVFTLGNGGFSNTSGSTYVAYCWAPIAGYSAFGGYTGNGSTDGPFIYTGFRPRFVMIKRSDSTSDWFIFDSARQPNNQMSDVLFPNLSNAETGSYPIDFVSNGFKNRNSAGVPNTSGGTFIYMAFAENPFKYALAR
jgi:hypothetical protein